MISAVSREGVDEALRALISVVEEARAEEAPVKEDDRWKK